jgi:hypothetical protein
LPEGSASCNVCNVGGGGGGQAGTLIFWVPRSSFRVRRNTKGCKYGAA